MDIEKPNCIGCHHIHPDNGNCTAVGGFCTAVPAAQCPMIPELRAENEKLRAELERVKVERDAYQVYFKDLSSKPDCNTCEKRNCDYRPRLGATVRANCPLYSGPQKED